MLRQWQGRAGLSRTFCQHFPASLKTGSRLSREPPAALPEPHDATRAGRSVFAGGLERGEAASVRVCVCVSALSVELPRGVCMCVICTHMWVYISQSMREADTHLSMHWWQVWVLCWHECQLAVGSDLCWLMQAFANMGWCVLLSCPQASESLGLP